MLRPHPSSTLFPYTTLFRSCGFAAAVGGSCVAASRSSCFVSDPRSPCNTTQAAASKRTLSRSEEHTSELQSLTNLVCRLLLEKKKIAKTKQAEPSPHLS